MWEADYGDEMKSRAPEERFFYVIRRAWEQTGRQVVVLIDEYFRNENYLYVDKTALIYQLVTKGKPYFLSRPRRFGRSLLIGVVQRRPGLRLY